ncbi:MAG: LysE family translocator [Minwuiales bacterium]|nr:LysE family translocator [Minwuiales bacterium]
MVDYLPGLFLAYSVFLFTILTPGPNNLAVIGASMSGGRTSGLALAFGVATGSFCWALSTALGLSALLASYAGALTAIKIAGGLYLLWLAYRSFRSAASDRDVDGPAATNAHRSPVGYYLRGLIIQLTNPKAALTWIAIISLGVQASATLGPALAIVAGTTLIAVVVHAAYAVAFSTAPAVRAYAKIRRWVQGALGIFFAAAGLRLITLPDAAD